MTTKKRTQKELKPIIKVEVDAFVVELNAKYPEIARSSLVDFITKEIRLGFIELYDSGKILTNSERWC